MDMLAQSISKPLRDIVRLYGSQLSILHPFEATVADLTVKAIERQGDRTLSLVLDDVNELRKSALLIGKEAASKAKTLEKKQEILELMDNGFAAMEELFKEVSMYSFPLSSPFYHSKALLMLSNTPAKCCRRDLL